MPGIVDVAGYVSLGAVPLFVAWDRLRPSRWFERPRGWTARAAAVSLVSLGLSIQAGLAWDRVFGGWSLLDVGTLGTLGGAAVGVLVYELVAYGYHRAAHSIDWLWRWSHQMHHSAESLEALGALYFHPLDIVLFTTWSSLVFFPLLGLSPEAGAVGAAFLSLNGVFQHANIRTPRWLGYLVQRPEAHGIHHERGVHAFNYADLPVFDMLFGTFRNPESWDGETGFYAGGSGRVAEMLAGRDVSEPKPDPRPAAAAPGLPRAA
jgi:sterol desaturase/sphingolipid hydroxylase (fatty acid hydroxylase superfamily)